MTAETTPQRRRRGRLPGLFRTRPGERASPVNLLTAGVLMSARGASPPPAHPRPAVRARWPTSRCCSASTAYVLAGGVADPAVAAASRGPAARRAATALAAIACAVALIASGKPLELAVCADPVAARRPPVSLASPALDLPVQPIGGACCRVELYRGEDALRTDRDAGPAAHLAVRRPREPGPGRGRLPGRRDRRRAGGGGAQGRRASSPASTTSAATARAPWWPTARATAARPSPAATTAGATPWTGGCATPSTSARSPGFDPRQYGLFPVRVETWRGLVFVNLDLAAAPLAEPAARPLAARWPDGAVPAFPLVERRSRTASPATGRPTSRTTSRATTCRWCIRSSTPTWWSPTTGSRSRAR